MLGIGLTTPFSDLQHEIAPNAMLAFLATLDRMMGGGLPTLENVKVIGYRGGGAAGCQRAKTTVSLPLTFGGV